MALGFMSSTFTIPDKVPSVNQSTVVPMALASRFRCKIVVTFVVVVVSPYSGIHRRSLTVQSNVENKLVV